LEISEQVKVKLTEFIVHKNLTKGTLLLEGGETCQHIYYIKKGFVRGFFNQDGKDITAWFAVENDIATSLYSFVTQKPSFENIEILENSILYVISYDNLQQLYHQYPEFNLIGRRFVEKYYVELMARTISLQFQSAKERYQQLLVNQPQLLQRASLGHIASYLGISQETLSRIRAKI
jgi:cAMP-binding proteins - catabolite gene activator and regulatory subunit of cAMP-dependent protein kinases